MPPYPPKQRDLIWLDFNPQAGTEVEKRRPALVISDTTYNQLTNLCIVCPIISTGPRNRFQIELPPGLQIEGTVLSDHVKSLDWSARRSKYIAKAPKNVHDQVLDALYHLMGMGRDAKNHF